MKAELPPVGATHTAMHTFTADEIRAFARMVGDANPLHHDEEAAARSRYGTLIASGTHSASVMMGVVASWTSSHAPAVGLGYSVRLRRAVAAGSACTITWRLVAVEHSAKLRGTVVRYEGSLALESGEIAVTGVSEAVVFD